MGSCPVNRVTTSIPAAPPDRESRRYALRAFASPLGHSRRTVDARHLLAELLVVERLSASFRSTLGPRLSFLDQIALS